jgi:tripartite-type tricarboxylate transporter receptor subunit TctC
MNARGLLAVSLLAVAAAAAAQESYPNRPLTMIVPYPPGGFVDLTARPYAAALEKHLKQPVTISNRGGAAGAVGTAATASSRPDGYTIALAASSISVIPEVDKLFERKAAFTLDQLAGIALLWTDPIYFVVNADSPSKTIKELIAAAKQRDGQMSFSSSGLYGAVHLPIEMVLQSAGVKMRHLPTNGGGPAITALLGSHVDMTAGGPAALTSHIKAGKFRGLAGSGAKRHELLPEVPTLMESGFNIEYYVWVGLFSPAGVPDAAQKVLRDAARRSAEDADFKAAMAKLYTPIQFLDAPEFRKFWERDARRLADVVKSVGRIEEKK